MGYRNNETAAAARTLALESEDARRKAGYLVLKGERSGFDKNSLKRIAVGLPAFLIVLVAASIVLAPLNVTLGTFVAMGLGMAAAYAATRPFRSASSNDPPMLWFRNEHLIYRASSGASEIAIPNQSILKVRSSLAKFVLRLRDGQRIEVFKRYESLGEGVLDEIFGSDPIPKGISGSWFELHFEHGQLRVELAWMESVGHRVEDVRKFTHPVDWPGTSPMVEPREPALEAGQKDELAKEGFLAFSGVYPDDSGRFLALRLVVGLLAWGAVSFCSSWFIPGIWVEAALAIGIFAGGAVAMWLPRAKLNEFPPLLWFQNDAIVYRPEASGAVSKEVALSNSSLSGREAGTGRIKIRSTEGQSLQLCRVYQPILPDKVFDLLDKVEEHPRGGHFNLTIDGGKLVLSYRWISDGHRERSQNVDWSGEVD